MVGNLIPILLRSATSLRRKLLGNEQRSRRTEYYSPCGEHMPRGSAANPRLLAWIRALSQPAESAPPSVASPLATDVAIERRAARRSGEAGGAVVTGDLAPPVGKNARRRRRRVGRARHLRRLQLGERRRRRVGWRDICAHCGRRRGRRRRGRGAIVFFYHGSLGARGEKEDEALSLRGS